MGIIVTPSTSSSIVAAASLAVSLATLSYTIWWQKRQAKRTALETYWFKEVIGPSCTDPLVAFWKKWSVQLSSTLGPPEKDAAKTTIDAFCTDKAELLRALWISELMFKDFYARAAEGLDEIEDLLSDALGKVFMADARGSGTEEETQQIATIREGLDTQVLAILRDLARRHCGTLSITNS